jgi:hypothetical protein
MATLRNLVPGLLAILALCAVAACTGTAVATPGATREPPSQAPSPSGPSGEPAALAPDVQAAILADAAGILAVPLSAVTVLSVDAVTWNDGSLGCPKPGSVYTQALIHGYRVIVGADTDRLDYRTGRGSAFKRCEGSFPGGAGS